MRKEIDTVPRNGDFVILEDDVRGTYAVARWSAEAAQWLDEEGTPSQLNATHWHPLTASQNIMAPVDEIGSLTEPRMSSAWRVAGGMTAQPQRGAKRRRSPNVWAGTFGFAWRGCGKILSAFAVVGGWLVRKRRSIVTMAACLLVGVAIGPLVYHSAKGLLPRAAPKDIAGLKQALPQEPETAGREKEAGDHTIVQLRQALQLELAKAEKLAGQLAEAERDGAVQAALARKAIEEVARAEAEKERVNGELRQALADGRTAEQLALKQERDKAETLRVELAAARRETESQAAILRSASAEATQMKEASARVADELRHALRQAQDKAEKLAGELAATRQEVEAQTALARAASDEARRLAETGKRSADEQALREAQGKAGKLATELAAARQEVEVQTALARAASDEARRAVETGKRSADEQGLALRETQGKAEKLAIELAAARREVQSQVALASSARDHAAGVTEAAERSADEQRRVLQQERDKTEQLASELAEARSRLQAQAKAKAAEEVAREDRLAAVQRELQTAKAEATAARESLEAERTRTRQVEQQLASAQERAAGRGSRSPTAASSTLGQPSTAAPSVAEAATKAPTVEQGSPQAVRLIARANLLLDQGNIGAARNVLDRAAEMGSAEALFWLAETYDPLLLSARQTFGTQSDIAKARELYGKALAGGVDQAKLRLEALQQ